jgi:hypothetical protein
MLPDFQWKETEDSAGQSNRARNEPLLRPSGIGRLASAEELCKTFSGSL